MWNCRICGCRKPAQGFECNAPETILVATDSGAVLLHGLKILSSINLLGTEIEI